MDAPDTLVEPSPSTSSERQLDPKLSRKPSNGTVHKPHKPALLAPAESKQLREQLLAEIGTLEDGDGLALWAHRRLAAKNTLIAEDARVVEAAYQSLLETCDTVPIKPSRRPHRTSKRPPVGPSRRSADCN